MKINIKLSKEMVSTVVHEIMPVLSRVLLEMLPPKVIPDISVGSPIGDGGTFSVMCGTNDKSGFNAGCRAFDMKKVYSAQNIPELLNAYFRKI